MNNLHEIENIPGLHPFGAYLADRLTGLASCAVTCRGIATGIMRKRNRSLRKERFPGESAVKKRMLPFER
jgi:hypothetical protein